MQQYDQECEELKEQLRGLESKNKSMIEQITQLKKQLEDKATLKDSLDGKPTKLSEKEVQNLREEVRDG